MILYYAIYSAQTVLNTLTLPSAEIIGTLPNHGGLPDFLYRHVVGLVARPWGSSLEI